MRGLQIAASTAGAQSEPRPACPLYVLKIVHMTDWVQAAPYLGRDSESTLEKILQNPSKSFTLLRPNRRLEA